MHFETLRKDIFKLAVCFDLYAFTCSSLGYFVAVAVVVIIFLFLFGRALKWQNSHIDTIKSKLATGNHFITH